MFDDVCLDSVYLLLLGIYQVVSNLIEFMLILK